MNRSRPLLGFRDFSVALQSLGIPHGTPVIVHASLSAFGHVRGGAETIAGALVHTFGRVLAPVFTYKTMIIPEQGPPDNGIKYGGGTSLNKMAQFFTPDMPADKLMGVVPEVIRNLPGARRSDHPILSFSGVGVDVMLEAQTLPDPLAPIRLLAESQGWVLLLGVDQTSNSSLHYAEKLAGRKQFLRWALTVQGVRECPGFPGCSNGFQVLERYFGGIVRETRLGLGGIKAMPLPEMLKAAYFQLRENPAQFLCTSVDCLRCDAVRSAIEMSR